MPKGEGDLLTEGRMVDRKIVDRFRLIVSRIRTAPDGLWESDAKQPAGLNPWGKLFNTQGMDAAQQAEELQRKQAKKQEWMEAFAEIKEASDENAALAALIDKHYQRFAEELRDIDVNLAKLGLGPDIPRVDDKDEQPS